jgi:hypothetical protein
LSIGVLLKKRDLNRKSLFLRVLAIIGIAYISVWVYMLLPFIIFQSISEGVWWSSGGPGSLFPIPSEPGIATEITPAYPSDAILYLVFLESGVWILWMLFLGLLALSPYRVDFHAIFRRRDGAPAE